MGIKKMRIMCCIAAFAVLAGTFASTSIVRADDEMSEGQKIAYESWAAEQRYIIEHGYDDNKHDNDPDSREEKAYKDGFTHVQSITMDIGDTHCVVGTDAHYGSSDPHVASVDSNGNITANNDGSCSVITYLKDGSLYNIVYITVNKPKSSNNNNNNNNNWKPVYNPYCVPYYAPYYAPYCAPVYTAPTVNPSWLAIANNIVAAAPRKGTVSLSSGSPLFLDSNFANMLKLRPDVTVNITYGYNGHVFLLTIPRGYNLASKLNAAGYVDFVTLSNVIDSKIRCKLLY